MGTGRSFPRVGRATSRLRFLLLAAVVAILVLYVVCPNRLLGELPPRRVQYDFVGNGVVAEDAVRARAVRDTMKDAFWKYREVAWGMDEVRPVSGGNSSSRNGWGATLVDSLTTTLMMGLEEEFKMQLGFVLDELDFSKAEGLVDPFETTIRYLGALVSTVDLLDANFTVFETPLRAGAREGLLAKAVGLAGLLGPGFDSPSGMPWPRINFTAGVGCREEEGARPYPKFWHATVGPARAGSNWLENSRLSALTGNGVYRENATRSWRPMVYSRWPEDWPGIIDGPWDIMDASPFPKDTWRSWGAGHDSYYEYLLKAHILSPHDPHSLKYRDRWLQSVSSVRKHLLFRNLAPRTRKSFLFLHTWHNGWLINEMGHLACFAGGNMMLGGRYLGREDIVDVGAELVDSCRAVYEATETRIGPEMWMWSREGQFVPREKEHVEQAKRAGWWAVDGRYNLRPETVESYFYAYRITGDKIYQDWAWDAYTAYIAATKAGHGYAELLDVNKPAGKDNQVDKSESFWSAETLKYLWLIFCDDSVASLDEWVFSTEAHPFRIGV